MTKKICVVIGLIIMLFWAFYFCVLVYEHEQRNWLYDEEIFSTVATVVSAVLMLIACIKANTYDMKATTVLFGVANVLFFISSIVFLSVVIDRHYYHKMTDAEMCFFLIQNGPLVVLWIIYGVSKTPRKVEKPKDVGGNIDITKADPKDYAAIVARSPMYNLRVYAYDKKGTCDPLLSALALEEVKEREAGRRKRLTEEDIRRQDEEKQKEEYHTLLAQKSDEELKSLLCDENMYDAVFIALAREELTNRVLGKTTAHNTATTFKNE